MNDDRGTGSDETLNANVDPERSDRDPFAELDLESVPDAAVDELFEEVDVPEIDDDAVWEAVFDDAAVSSDTVAEDGADAVVSKRQFCGKCEYFADPPATACTNSGTEILELVGVGQFRLQNCPVVARQQRAETVFPDDA